jgi:hypothetical protein
MASRFFVYRVAQYPAIPHQVLGEHGSRIESPKFWTFVPSSNILRLYLSHATQPLKTRQSSYVAKGEAERQLGEGKEVLQAGR